MKEGVWEVRSPFLPFHFLQLVTLGRKPLKEGNSAEFKTQPKCFVCMFLKLPVTGWHCGNRYYRGKVSFSVFSNSPKHTTQVW